MTRISSSVDHRVRHATDPPECTGMAWHFGHRGEVTVTQPPARLHMRCRFSRPITKGTAKVLVTGFPAEAFGTNCYILAAAPGEPCLIVDPGIGVIKELDELLAEHRLVPAAVMLTHGHLDHVFSVAPVCGARGSSRRRAGGIR